MDVKARFQAQVELDLAGSSVGQDTSVEDKLRLGKARTFHKLISSREHLPQVIEKLNELNTVKYIKFKTILVKGDFAEVIVQCGSERSIQNFYDMFLRRELKRILEKVLLTSSFLRKARLEEVTIDVDVSTDHIAKKEKDFKEKMYKAQGGRFEKRGSVDKE